MKKILIAIILAFTLITSLTACGGGEETTLSGMVVSVNGTVISLVEMDSSTGFMDSTAGKRPEVPEGMEPTRSFEGFDGTFPDGETMPQPPEGMTMPEGGEMPDFADKNGSMRPGFGPFGEDTEATELDFGNARISVEIDEGKATGSMDDIVPGTYVTITMNENGEITNVLVSSRTGFNGGRRPQN